MACLFLQKDAPPRAPSTVPSNANKSKNPTSPSSSVTLNWIRGLVRNHSAKTSDAPLKDAHTDFQTRQRLSHLPHPLTLLEARPRTGRNHQIRKHLLHCGHPIVGDYFYHGYEPCEEMGPLLGIGTRMLLQCHRLQFNHPITKDPLLITAPTEANIVRLCES